MKFLKVLLFLVVVTAMGIAQSNDSTGSSPANISSDDVKQLREALAEQKKAMAEQQKQVSEQRQEIEKLKQQIGNPTTPVSAANDNDSQSGRAVNTA